MLSRILELFGSCSNRTSWLSTVSRLSLVSVRNSRNRSSIRTRLPSTSVTVGCHPFFASKIRNPDLDLAEGSGRKVTALPAQLAKDRVGDVTRDGSTVSFSATDSG